MAIFDDGNGVVPQSVLDNNPTVPRGYAIWTVGVAPSARRGAAPDVEPESVSWSDSGNAVTIIFKAASLDAAGKFVSAVTGEGPAALSPFGEKRLNGPELTQAPQVYQLGFVIKPGKVREALERVAAGVANYSPRYGEIMAKYEQEAASGRAVG